MSFIELDTVVILKDYPNEGLKKGDIGVVVSVHTVPNEAYEIEFVDDEGKTKSIIVLEPHEIEKYVG
ncbi:DUF4926 domain-containing protein [Anoxybacteroides amylolyticum]|uniref:DUF4926 domain-containing protein n=1 Tax=Anoxybacteroides amylolyticum TaxID=294699 RepID=A0A160F228_9BACL|nr:DUF4926 domain-containing protein [Anoxybacillus amylolyticus]ANB59655.1 hypothetical protein GFC30_749 [Anoxybacillus amylolyticus]